MHWWLPLVIGIAVLVVLGVVSAKGKSWRVKDNCAWMAVLTVAVTIAVIFTLQPPQPLLPKAAAVHYSKNVVKAAAIITLPTPDATLGSTLISSQHQLIDSTYATEISFAGQTQTTQYFRIRVANQAISPFAASTCLTINTSTGSYRVVYGACKVPKFASLSPIG
jgi:hypothetical protein